MKNNSHLNENISSDKKKYSSKGYFFLNKDVTQKMLEDVGFRFHDGGGLIHGTRESKTRKKYHVYTIISWPTFPSSERKVIWNNPDCHLDIKPHIQDLIDLGYVKNYRRNNSEE